MTHKEIVGNAIAGLDLPGSEPEGQPQLHINRRLLLMAQAGTIGTLTDLEARVLLVVFAHSNYHTGVSFLSTGTIAKEAGCLNKHRTREALKRLADKGILPVINQGGGRRDGESETGYSGRTTRRCISVPASVTGTLTVPLKDTKQADSTSERTPHNSGQALQDKDLGQNGRDEVPSKCPPSALEVPSGGQRGTLSDDLGGRSATTKGDGTRTLRGTRTVPLTTVLTPEEHQPQQQAASPGGCGGGFDSDSKAGPVSAKRITDLLQANSEEAEEIDRQLRAFGIAHGGRRKIYATVPSLTLAAVEKCLQDLDDNAGPGLAVETLVNDGEQLVIEAEEERQAIQRRANEAAQQQREAELAAQRRAHEQAQAAEAAKRKAEEEIKLIGSMDQDELEQMKALAINKHPSGVSAGRAAYKHLSPMDPPLRQAIIKLLHSGTDIQKAMESIDRASRTMLAIQAEAQTADKVTIEDEDMLKVLFDNLLAELEGNVGVHPLLLNGRLCEIIDGMAVVVYEAEHDQFPKMLNRNGKRELVAKVLSEIIGKTVDVRFIADVREPATATRTTPAPAAVVVDELTPF